jgi:small-conductance mechanosensitive channel/CRP-like cAMP-binding protein
MVRWLSDAFAAAAGSIWTSSFGIAIAFFIACYLRRRNSAASFLLQVLVLASITGLMLTRGIVPFRPGIQSGPAMKRLLVGVLEAAWWLAMAWLTVGFLRAFVVLGRKPNESKLILDLVAALIYLTAAVAIVANVFELPVKGLLATSGALAIIVGLALQSSLGDVFSGIVLNLERPYHVGDYIILDDAVQGRVIETTWRAIHVLTPRQDVAVIPNSVVAKAKIINCSAPVKTHGASIRVKLDASLPPVFGCNLMREVLLGSTHVLRAPEPSVTIQEISADMIDFELSYSVAEMSALDVAQNEILDRIYRAAAAAGVRFAPRLGAVASQPSLEDTESGAASRLLDGITLFATLTSQEKASLASQMKRKEYKPGDVVVSNGATLQSLNIVRDGVLVASESHDGHTIERLRLTPGVYFGESALLTGTPLTGQITALTKVVIYELSKPALMPLLKARPSMTEELSELLASRQLARRTILDQLKEVPVHEVGLAGRLAASIERFFALHGQS